MPNHNSGAIRNFSLIGGPGSGKTSLAEALLHKAGAIARLGSIAEGTTVSDFEAEEKAKEHSVALGVLYADYDGHRLNILDAPGYPDFIGEAATALAATETAVLCVKAGEGVTFQTHRVWGLAGKAERARAVVVTGIDHVEFDWDATLTEIGEVLGARCLAVVVPEGSGEQLGGVSRVPFGAGADGALGQARDALIEAVVEADEGAMTRFLEEDAPPDEAETRKLLTQSMISGDVVPVLAVSSLDGKGIAEFLAFVTDCFPSPEDGPHFKDVEGNDVAPDAEGASAFIFKTFSDAFVGKLCMARVVSGSLASGQTLLLQRTEKPEKIPALQLKQGKDQTPTESVVAGDIVAIPKVDALETSDTLCDAAHPRTYPPVAVPKPMVARAIHPKDHKDDAKLSDALRKAVTEDATFIFDRDESTGQMLVHGITMMHLETCLKRIKQRSKVEIEIELPKVPFRETITLKMDGHHRHKKQTGGRGQFGEVYLSVEPGERGTGLDFQDATVGGSVPRQFIPAIEKGVRELMAKGIIAGCLVVDVVVKITDGKFHNVDSDEASFKLAGARAFKDAFLKAKPVLLEPLFDMEIATPSSHMGAITSDITGRRGHILGMDSIGETQIVRARVPQREVLTYPTALQALTQGEGAFTAVFHDYELVPSNVQQEIMAEFQPEADVD